MKVWTEMAASDGDFALAAGGKYAVLASVSKNFSLLQVENYLAGHGFSVDYAWEYGDTVRPGGGPIDSWLASLPADATDNHRWVYGEVTRTGGPTTIGAKAPWPFSFYTIAHAFSAVEVPDAAAAGPLPAPEAAAQAPAVPAPLAALPAVSATSAASTPPAWYAARALGAFALVSVATIAAAMWWDRRLGLAWA